MLACVVDLIFVAGTGITGWTGHVGPSWDKRVICQTTLYSFPRGWLEFQFHPSKTVEHIFLIIQYL